MNVRFGYGSPNGVRDVAEILDLAAKADRAGLDVFSVSDHPYLADHLDAYALISYILGRTERISTLVNVTNLPLRPAPMLARTATSLTALSNGRFVLGLGAGGAWDRITSMGVPNLRPAEAVAKFEEAMVLIHELSGGGPAVTNDSVRGIVPAAVPAPLIWTGSNGPKSLAATGRQADGWIPGHAADWISETYQDGRRIIDEAALSVGRKPSDIATIFNLPGVITSQPRSRVRDADGRWIGGSPAQWIEELTAAVLQYGAAGFTLFARGTESLEHTLELWAHEIAPAVRAATS